MTNQFESAEAVGSRIQTSETGYRSQQWKRLVDPSSMADE